jgi:hypothetical protein
MADVQQSKLPRRKARRPPTPEKFGLPACPTRQHGESEARRRSQRGTPPGELDGTVVGGFLSRRQDRLPHGARKSAEGEEKALTGYPLYSDSPNRLCFARFALAARDEGAIRFRRGRHCLLDQAKEKLPAAPGFPSVEAEGKLVQVVHQVRVADGTLMGSPAATLR